MTIKVYKNIKDKEDKTLNYIGPELTKTIRKSGWVEMVVVLKTSMSLHKE